MSEKRRDNKGRILKTGESQRKDLSYQYRYNDTDGVRRTVYASSLSELREKEKQIQAMLDANLLIAKGDITLACLVEEHLSLKRNIRQTTRASYDSVLRRLKSDPFGQRTISSIKPIEARKWLISLSESGYSYGTVLLYKSLVKSAFNTAIENEYVLKNPFSFKFDFLLDNTEKKEALTKEQQNIFFNYLKNSSYYSKYYDLCVILVETGLRVGELCGLTIRDIDFANKTINIDHQIVRTTKSSRGIAPPKTEAGKRIIPMTHNVETAIRNVIRNRPLKPLESISDGQGFFLFVSRNGKPYCSSMIDHIFHNIRNDYLKSNVCLPEITPHTLRHTFCTNMINSGMLPKHVQYLMGHNDIDVTMNVYTSVDRAEVFESMRKLFLIS